MADLFKTMNKLEIFPEEDYKKIIAEVGAYRYRIYNKEEKLPCGILGRIKNVESYNYVIAGTGATISNYTLNLNTQSKLVIPKDEQVIVVRLLRYDNGHGNPHFNADDQIIIPTKKGDFFRVPRKDTADHYIGIAKGANMLNIAEAYKLPLNKEGPINAYHEKGASLHIELLPCDLNLEK
jgi:hypothetical protein